MEEFFVDDEFFETLTELIESYFDDEQEVYELDDSYTLDAREAILEKVIDPKYLSKSEIISNLMFENYGEEIYDYESTIRNILEKYIQIDTESIIKELPEVYTNYGDKFKITKKDLINHIEG
jgi:hypothetical protein